MKILCVIGARGGSKGLPGKNIRIMLGKPLIVWSIKQAVAVKRIERVVVSTDSHAIADVARAAGAEIPFMRPEALSGASVGKFQVWQHTLNFCEDFYKCKFDILVDLDCTNPLRDTWDIDKALDQFLQSHGRGVDAVFSVCEARKNPYFNIVESDENGALKMSKSVGDIVLCRQKAPKVFDHVASIYVLSAEYVKKSHHLLDGHAEGYNIGYDKSHDIDSQADAEIVEFLMKKKYGFYSET